MKSCRSLCRGESAFDESKLTDKTEDEEGRAHPIPINPLAGVPQGGFGTATLNQLSSAAKAAVESVGSGRGPVYGTKVHTEFKAQIRAMGRYDLHSEQSYLKGSAVDYGTLGSIRVDAAEGHVQKPHTVYDLKTGNAGLTNVRV